MKKAQWIKILIIWLVYVLLHFTYKIAPSDLTRLFGCPVETIFHHMKMAFLSYSLFSIVEYFVIKPPHIPGFISTRMLSAILFSYFSFVIWFLIPSVFGPIESVWFEIVYSNLILALCLAATVHIESFTAKITFDKKVMAVIIALFSVILIVFVISTYRTPPMEVFEPHLH
jgi:hypothetical protein